MPDQLTLDSTIDPLTGTTSIAEGADVYVRDDAGKVHRATVLAVHLNAERRYTVLIVCRKRDRELTVREDDILARAYTDGDR